MPDKTIVIEDATLTSMAANAAFLKEFPFLGALRGPQPGDSRCGRCSGKQTDKRGKQRMAIKAAIGGLTPLKATKLKEMLGATKIVIKYHDRLGKPAERTL